MDEKKKRKYIYADGLAMDRMKRDDSVKEKRKEIKVLFFIWIVLILIGIGIGKIGM